MLKRILKMFFALWTLWAAALTPAMAQQPVLDRINSAVDFGTKTVARADAGLPRSEQILAYDVTASVQEDASLTVREDLTVMVTNDRIKKGIVRAFPVDYRDAKGRAVTVGFDVLSTSVDGAPMKWAQSKEGRAVMVRVGDPDRTLEPGLHRFTLEYRTTRQLGFYEDHDELYWNVTGNEWKFPILKATFSLNLPGEKPGQGFSAIQWYTGPTGSKSNGGAQKNADGSVSTTAALTPGEGLTVVYAWPKGVIAPPEPSAADRLNAALFDAAEPLARAVLWGGAGLAALCAALALRKALRNRRAATTVIPLFRAPEGMTPAMARYVQRLEADRSCFSAELLNLAVAGDIKIQSPSKKSFRLVWQKRRGELKLDPLDLAISKALFSDWEKKGASLSLEQDNRLTFTAAREAMEKRLAEAGAALFSIDRRLVLMIYAALFISGLLVCLLGAWLDGGVLEETLTAAGVVCSLSVFCFFWALRRSPGNAGKGFIRSAFLWAGLGFLAAITFLFGEGTGWMGLYGLCAALLASGILLSPHSVAYTEAGLEAAAAVQGLKMYIGAAEKDRLEMFNPPNDTPEVFERLLPYAVALDCVKTWAARFDSVLRDAGYRPRWYDGDDLWRGGDLAALSAAQMASSLNGFASNFSSTLSTTMTAPGSSSGLSDSGGGGGGCSGGGGGGGGGDGW